MAAFSERKKQYLNTEVDPKPDFNRGIDYQRERFKMAKIRGEFDTMADTLENIKSEIKSRALAQKHGDNIKKIEAILNWYRNKEQKHIIATPNGRKIRFPPNMPQIINHNLTLCYEMLIAEADGLNLLR